MILLPPHVDNPSKVYRLGIYHPYWNYANGHKERNPDFNDFSAKILSLKDKEDEAIGYFFNRINGKINKKITICVVPSHKETSEVSGIGLLAKKLIADGRLDGLVCLQRVTEIKKLSKGGDRDIDVHLNSIKVRYTKRIEGAEILLIDDVSTTKNSIRACQQLLMSADAKKVLCLVLGQTKR